MLASATAVGARRHHVLGRQCLHAHLHTLARTLCLWGSHKNPARISCKTQQLTGLAPFPSYGWVWFPFFATAIIPTAVHSYPCTPQSRLSFGCYFALRIIFRMKYVFTGVYHPEHEQSQRPYTNTAAGAVLLFLNRHAIPTVLR